MKFANDCGLVDRQLLLKETVAVNSAYSVKTLSNINLLSGKQYKLESSGTWTNSNNVSDTEFASTDNWVSHFDGYNIAPYMLGEGEFDLQVNGNFVDWGSYNSGHVYSRFFTGLDAKVGFMVFDGDSDDVPPIIQSGWYGDNNGSLTVKIYELL